jgi:wyosine [tRNA(Phe)-imidazoG37] synthetase (radical SAM superfamily)
MHRKEMGRNSIIYGPVPSWRLGRSLGIDLLSTEGKTCSLDCVYCQLGRTVHPSVERKEFVTASRLTEELERVKGVIADYITFSGVGEPTLAVNLGEAITLAKSVLGLPVAVLTNSSLMTREDVRRDLGLADVVVAKVDAPDEEIFRQVNRPFIKRSLEEVIQAINLFREQYKGKLALQMMFIDANKNYAEEMAAIAEKLSPDEVQLNTPLRPCAIQPLPPENIDRISGAFNSLKNVITIYEAPRPEVAPLDLKETLKRRPKLNT